MAEDPNTQLSAELEAALQVLAPQIRGLNDLAATPMSAPLREEIQLVQRQRMHRADLIRAALHARDRYVEALEAMEADGYPSLPKVVVGQAFLNEIAAEEVDIDAAVALFVGEQPAATVSIGLGAPKAKT